MPRRQPFDPTDLQIIHHLRANARIPVASLAGSVGLSRSTVHERLSRLTDSGALRFTVQVVGEAPATALRAYMLVWLEGPQCERVAKTLVKIPQIVTCESIGGEIDMILTIEADSTKELSDVRSEIEAIHGVRRVTTGIVLTERFNRK